MLSNEEKNKYRSELFRQLDGITVAPIVFSNNDLAKVSINYLKNNSNEIN